MHAAVSFANGARVAPVDPGGAGCPTLASVRMIWAKRKRTITAGYNMGNDGRLDELIMVKFEGTADTQWKAIVAMPVGDKAPVFKEMIALHRYAQRVECTDNSTPLKYCACHLEGGAREDYPEQRP